jgi:DNA-binding winged helix-turn-helix (wHTH) protein
LVLFGDCSFDTDRRQLFRAGTEVHLSRKAFDLLGILIASQPRVVSKAELQERLWPSTFVVEANLSNLVAEVRRALLDDPKTPRYVRTVHGVGYAFCGVSAQDSAPSTQAPIGLWLLFGDSRLPLVQGEHLIGRSPKSIVPISDITISRNHARIVVGDEVIVVDLGSRNGTYLNGERVLAPSALRHGDRLTVGSLMMTFIDAHPGASTVDHPTQSQDSYEPPRETSIPRSVIDAAQPQRAHAGLGSPTRDVH